MQDRRFDGATERAVRGNEPGEAPTRAPAREGVLHAVGVYRIAVVALATVLLTTGVIAFGNTRDDVFAVDNAAAMDRMMKAMDVAPSGDVTRTRPR